MSNLNDAKQLILETEIDNVIEEGFLDSLNKVKFEVAAVLAGAGVLLFKLPEYISKLIMKNDIIESNKLIASHNIASADLETKISAFSDIVNHHNELMAKAGKHIDDIVVGVANRMGEGNWLLQDSYIGDLVQELLKGGKAAPDKVLALFDKSIGEASRMSASAGVGGVTKADASIFKWTTNQLNEAKKAYADAADSGADMIKKMGATQKELIRNKEDFNAEASKINQMQADIKEHVSNSAHSAQLIIAIMIGVAIILIIFKLWKYFKSNPDEKKAKLKSVLSNFKSSLTKLK